ncbi:hypothetical protein SAMN05216350_105190 [Polaromonas sp. YR568]|uniref:hypothetical protein n=1 Tax=Polaromonas sp. YR568 TaxID=1855301 RepID=UPI0008E9E5DF|nr:hypothetical protein [Polaromonas sp. YR568]SFU79690.1 hypothetical protein SAMN05216350_105190 [Polaromonas sp. YR568]
MQTTPTPVHRRVEPLPWRIRPRVLTQRREWALAGVLLLLLAAALLGPSVAQPGHYHDFADQRAWGALPHAMDVISNLPFALWGMVGVWALLRAVRVRAVSSAAAAMAALFFGGLWVTAAVSAAYHLQPDDVGLVWDRTGMVLAFAGLLGLAVMQAVSTRAGLVLAVTVLVLGPLSVHEWSVTGNVLPWAVLQFGGMALILGRAFMRPAQAQGLPVRWGLLIAIYALAKLLELGDHAVYEWTGQLVSGHSLKHVVASFAAWPVVSALLATRKIKAESTAPSTREQAGRLAKARRTTTEMRGQA